MEYQVQLKSPHDFTSDADYINGHVLCDENKFGIWFKSLEEAKTACIKHNGYGVYDSEELEYVWINPNYQSEGIKKLSQFLGKKLLPRK